MCHLFLMDHPFQPAYICLHFEDVKNSICCNAGVASSCIVCIVADSGHKYLSTWCSRRTCFKYRWWQFLVSKLVRFICYSTNVAVCPDNCGNSSCMSDGQCCHEYCLGGCTGPGPEDCLVCRDVVFEYRCVKQCPPQTYKVNQVRSCEVVWFGKSKEARFQIWGLHSVEDLCCSFDSFLFEYPWFRDTCCLCICGEDQRLEALCISEQW